MQEQGKTTVHARCHRSPFPVTRGCYNALNGKFAGPFAFATIGRIIHNFLIEIVSRFERSGIAPAKVVAAVLNEIVEQKLVGGTILQTLLHAVRIIALSVR
jgi:hypothetical protein